MTRVVCSSCGSPSRNELEWRCSECSEPFTIESDAPFDTRKVASAELSLWRYRAFLPEEARQHAVSLGEGLTPLVNSGEEDVMLKLDYVMPTGSFKDRGSTVLISTVRSIMRRHGIKRVVEDSSGNAGASIAAYCTNAGVGCDIYSLTSIAPRKEQQITAYGARLHKIEGDREVMSAAAQRAAARSFYASHIWNPFFIAGTKTVAYEISEALGWNAPDAVFIPTSAGTLLLGAIQGFEHLREADIIEHTPLIVAVQPEAVSPIYHALRGSPYKPTHVSRLADALVSQKPARLKQIISTLKRVKGDCEIVSDREIAAATKELASRGFFAEPSSAVSWAAWRRWRLKGKLKDNTVVLVLTGSGLKSWL